MIENNFMFWYVFNFLDIFMYFIFFKFLVDISNNKTKSNKINFISLLIATIVSFFIGYKITLIYMLAFIVFYRINYSKGIIKIICCSCGYWILIYRLIEFVSLRLVCMANYSGIYNISKPIDANIVLIEVFIYKIILFLLLYTIFFLIKKFYTLKKTLTLLIFIPIFTNALSLLMTFRYKAVNNNSNIELVIMLFLVSVSNIIFYIILKISSNIEKIKSDNKILVDNILKEYDYYLKVYREQSKVKEIYHDIKNHMICIRDMCENNDINNILNYIDKLELGLKKHKNKDCNFNTGNMILDSILKNKYSLCKDKGIKFYASMDFSKSGYMDMTDICIIFSNIIDNAIEACEKIKSKKLLKEIKIESKYIEDFLVIKIENTKENQIILKKNKLITSKKNKYVHGIGLKNVHNVVKKYFGEVVIEHCENKFILKIMIP